MKGHSALQFSRATFLFSECPEIFYLTLSFFLSLLYSQWWGKCTVLGLCIARSQSSLLFRFLKHVCFSEVLQWKHQLWATITNLVLLGSFLTVMGPLKIKFDKLAKCYCFVKALPAKKLSQQLALPCCTSYIYKFPPLSFFQPH